MATPPPLPSPAVLAVIIRRNRLRNIDRHLTHLTTRRPRDWALIDMWLDHRHALTGKDPR